MKKCPTCDKEFPDSMRFCQTDGTLLVEKKEDVDPYKTVVGKQDDIGSATPLDPFKTMVASPPPKVEDDILDISKEDSLKTMIVSKDELKAGLASEDSSQPKPYAPSAPLIEPKPKASNPTPPSETSAPKNDSPFSSPPNFGNDFSNKETSVSNDATAIIDKNDISSPGSSPFDSKPNDFSGKSPYGNQDSKPIPSPFDLSMPPGYMPPTTSPFEDSKPNSPVTPFDEPKASNSPFQQNFDEPKPASSPFDSPTPFGGNDPFNQNPPLQQSDWTPPPAPDANWQNQAIGSNSPLQPPVAGQSLNQTLPIVSLILGIVSLCCYVSPITGIAALITGYLGMKNANTNPNEYGGKTLAIIGMILGGLFLLVGIVYYILWLVIGFASFAGR